MNSFSKSILFHLSFILKVYEGPIQEGQLEDDNGDEFKTSKKLSAIDH